MDHTFNCPSCGAPLEIEGDSLSIVCKYCGDTVAVPEEFRPHPIAAASSAAAEAPSFAPEDAEAPEVVPAGNNNYAWAMAIIIFVTVVLFSSLLSRSRTSAQRPTESNPIAYFSTLSDQEMAKNATEQAANKAQQLEQAKTATEKAFSATRPPTATTAPETLDSHFLVAPVILPADSGSAFPDFLVEDSAGYYIRADGATKAVLWKSDPLPEQGSQFQAFIVEKQALLVNLTSISALDLETGKAAWKALISSGLGKCSTCLVQSGSTLLALLKDGTIQAMDASSGKLTWHKTLKGIYSDIFLAGGLPALAVQDGGKWTLDLLDPQTGNVSRTIQPTCLGGKKVPAVMNVVDAGAGNKELFMLGEGCVQIISLPDGKVQAQVTDRQFAAHPDSIWSGNSYLVSDNAVYYASASKSVNALDLASGTTRELLADPSYDLKPLTLSGNALVLENKSSPDSQHQYWGVDATSGQKLWNFPVNGQAVVHFLANGDVFVYKWQLGTHEWTVINPQTGSDTYQIQVVSGGGLSYEFAWYKDSVYIIRDHRLVIMDALTGKSPTGRSLY